MAEEVQAHTGAEAGGGIANELMAPQPGIMIWVWVVFIALVVLLHKFAWKPILASVAERERKLKESLENLSYRERRVLELRYGLGGEHPRTLDEVGRTFNVTRERIRQIENQSLKKLQSLNEAQKLREAT